MTELPEGGPHERYGADSTSVTFVPPKPNEFDSAWRSAHRRRVEHRRVVGQLGVERPGVDRRRHPPVLQHQQREDRLDGAGRRHGVPGVALGRRIGHVPVAEHGADRAHLGHVARRRRRAVRVDVVDVGRASGRRGAAPSRSSAARRPTTAPPCRPRRRSTSPSRACCRESSRRAPRRPRASRAPRCRRPRRR